MLPSQLPLITGKLRHPCLYTEFHKMEISNAVLRTLNFTPCPSGELIPETCGQKKL